MKKYEELTIADLTVHGVDGKPKYAINKFLLRRQDCEENRETILELHELKLAIYSMIEETDNREELRDLALDLQEVEFCLQEMWKFEKDAKFHRFWEYPKCTCPKMDNEDWYPHRQVISMDCPLHGKSPAELAKIAAEKSIRENKAKQEAEEKRLLDLALKASEEASLWDRFLNWCKSFR